MFTKCNYIYALIYSLDIPQKDKLNLCIEIGYLINLIMFGVEELPASIHFQGEKNA